MMQLSIIQLSWNTSEYGGVDSVVIQPRNLWIPDILLYNRYMVHTDNVFLITGDLLNI